MKSPRKASTGGVLNILIFSALTFGGAYLFHFSFSQKENGTQEEIGRVIEESGNVTIKAGKAQGWFPARQLDPVYDKTSIFTGATSRAAVQVRNTLIHVDEKTLIQIIDPMRKTELIMDFGGLRLSAKQKEQVILNIAGERIRISLEASSVKIKRDKKSRVVKIESESGPVKVESVSHPEETLSQGKTLELAIAAQNEPNIEEPPVQAAPEKPKLQLNYQSEYTNDEVFSRRPRLNVAVLSDVRDAKFEVSEDGHEWKPVEDGKFIPPHEGEFLVRAHGIFADGQEAETEPAPWSPKSEHFQLRQPALRKNSFALDPTDKPRNKNLFQEFPAATKAVEFRLESTQTVKLASNGKFSAEQIPAGAKSVRVTSLDLPFAVDPKWAPIDLSVAKPHAFSENGLITVRPIRLDQYYYEAVVEGEGRTVEFNDRNKADPACASSCTVAVRFKSHLNPQWSSDATRIKIKPSPPPLLRALAAETPNEVAVEKLKLTPIEYKSTAPWVFEAGVGGNYLNMSTTSSLTNATSSGFSGPGLFASGEHQMENYNLKASYLGIFTKMKNVSATGTTEQNLAWQSVWAGASQSGWGFLKRFEYGATYQQMPLFYQNASNEGQFQNANMIAGTIGFNTGWGLGQKGHIVWDQRVMIPFVAKSSGTISSFSPKFGVEGNLTYYHCIANNWAVGGSWLGQYLNAKFSLREEPGLQAESPSTSMFNSNFQLRLQYGLCGAASAQAN